MSLRSSVMRYLPVSEIVNAGLACVWMGAAVVRVARIHSHQGAARVVDLVHDKDATSKEPTVLIRLPQL